uniref:Uncharacterized protein n=1 Tax=Chromera velia CCMP2878 TaxID=1169474 RepID=A0A0G4ID89_9ALVE|eukprot:Cvel_13309.t1-p1 / transcript=Cvel_13309.t1 / gene=Cvel_13309 / organism=Chromera_velia_CCMP2878 / gene_product=hypothetical protein / transcript_product=hypothetical protein / location=Cvel_scaffold903:29189-31514(+) / protein_length=101 / sequence_SO=supercontig / SO=protein_coding / is_pseudo=false
MKASMWSVNVLSKRNLPRRIPSGNPAVLSSKRRRRKLEIEENLKKKEEEEKAKRSGPSGSEERPTQKLPLSASSVKNTDKESGAPEKNVTEHDRACFLKRK